MYKKRIIFAVLLICVLFVHFFSSQQGWVESYYVKLFYPSFSGGLRIIFGWIPFSLGDCVYGGLALVWIRFIVLKCRALLRKEKVRSKGYPSKIYFAFVGISLVYLIFNTFWGINYNRLGVAHQLGIKIEKYTVEDLRSMNAKLIEKVNQSKSAILKDSSGEMSTAEMINRTYRAYSLANKKYSFLKLSHPVLKKSLWGWVGNYLGFAGYYNPFTGESQINTQVPFFLQPYIACHELGHQLGYAKEMEANFVGYLVAKESDDESFRYSVYLQLFVYANNNLYRTDSISAKQFSEQLQPAVKADIGKWGQYNRKYKNPIEPFISWMYGLFLKGNQQPQGLLSYDQVVGFLIAFYKKNGVI